MAAVSRREGEEKKEWPWGRLSRSLEREEKWLLAEEGRKWWLAGEGHRGQPLGVRSVLLLMKRGKVVGVEELTPTTVEGNWRQKGKVTGERS